MVISVIYLRGKKKSKWVALGLYNAQTGKQGKRSSHGKIWKEKYFSFFPSGGLVGGLYSASEFCAWRRDTQIWIPVKNNFFYI